MPYWQFMSCLRGYRERTLDEMCLCVLNGFYSGYYHNAKRPQKPSVFINKIISSGRKNLREVAGEVTEVDMNAEVAKFQEREERFLHEQAKAKRLKEQAAKEVVD